MRLLCVPSALRNVLHSVRFLIGESAPGQPQFKIIYYNGRTIQNKYDGAFVYARTPEVPQEALPAIYRYERAARTLQSTRNTRAHGARARTQRVRDARTDARTHAHPHARAHAHTHALTHTHADTHTSRCLRCARSIAERAGLDPSGFCKVRNSCGVPTQLGPELIGVPGVLADTPQPSVASALRRAEGRRSGEAVGRAELLAPSLPSNPLVRCAARLLPGRQCILLPEPACLPV